VLAAGERSVSVMSSCMSLRYKTTASFLECQVLFEYGDDLGYIDEDLHCQCTWRCGRSAIREKFRQRHAAQATAITDVDLARSGPVSGLKQNGESMRRQRVKGMGDNQRFNVSVG